MYQIIHTTTAHCPNRHASFIDMVVARIGGGVYEIDVQLTAFGPFVASVYDIRGIERKDMIDVAERIMVREYGMSYNDDLMVINNQTRGVK